MPRRCRVCRNYSIPKSAPKTQFVCGAECARTYVAEGAFKAREQSAKRKAAKPKKKKLKTIAKLVDEAAVLLQKLVRMKAATPEFMGGICRCVTCGKLDHWQSMQGGHFLERGRKATKLLEENCAPQCPGCNLYLMRTASGVLAYREYMVSMYGEKFVQDLIIQSKQTKKYTRAEVEGIIFDFKRQIQQQDHRLSGRGMAEEERSVA